MLLHGIRIAMIQRICLMATEIPISVRSWGSRATMSSRASWSWILPSSVERLRQIFPHKDGVAEHAR